MSIVTAIILGIIQGLTEFLPVSSSGHLVLFQKIFGISQPALFFDTMVHIGTLASVVVVLRREIWAILRKIVQPLTAYLVIATIPVVVFALALSGLIERAFESGRFLGFAFLITAAILAAAEIMSKRAAVSLPAGGKTAPLVHGDDPQTDRMNWLDALIVGVMQAAAIIPGVSRSGATLSGALARRLDRDFAARFSFLLSIPAILAALVFQLKDLIGVGAVSGGTESAGAGIGAIIAGTLSAAVTGFFAIRFMLKIVREKSLFGFAVYTGILGILVLLDQFALHLVF